ncbi:MAG TPA: ATP-binding protein [Acidobacteriaceae bacterium]
MQLRTKLVLTATGLTFAIVALLCVVFLGELLRQRILQTYQANDMLARQVLLVTRQAVETGLTAHPPPPTLSPDDYEDALHAAVLDALRSSDELTTVMDGIVKYSPPVQDVSVTDAEGFTMVSTDIDAVNQRASYRDSFDRVRSGGIIDQMREVFGPPKVLDISAPLDRNRMPFLVVHIGVRSSLLRAAYEPWLRAALEFALLATFAAMAGAALLSTLALRPLRTIGEQLERLTLTRGDLSADPLVDQPLSLDSQSARTDPVGRVSRTIDRLGRQMRSREEGYTALQTNLNQMLDTLRDGVLLFAPDRRAVMVSDAVANFIERPDADADGPLVEDMVGKRLEEIFPPGTRLGGAILAAFERGAQISAETVALEDGRQVQISLDRIGDSRTPEPATNGNNGHPDSRMGTLLTLRDTGSALELEQELEVSRRLAAIGKLSANVGHEVKNPINAMVVHLELLRGKLAADSFDRNSAQKHVQILADEMHRLDRVVETLADFSRPMDLDLREHDLRRVVDQTLELAGAEFRGNGVSIESESPPVAVPVRVDAELIRQAFLNLLLNALQAMPGGGVARVTVRRDHRFAIVEFADNGVGIPASVLPRIFDLYFTTKSKGSGIGLAMTYRIVQLHGGAMQVRSNSDPASADHGTTFTLSIPISAAPVSESRRQSARLPAEAETAPADTQASIATTMERKEVV